MSEYKLNRCSNWDDEYFMMSDYYEPTANFSVEELYQAFKHRIISELSEKKLKSFEECEDLNE